MSESSSPTDEIPVPGVTFIVPIEAFRSKAVTAAIGPSDVVDNNDAHSKLTAAFVSASEAGDDPSANALQILAAMASYHFVPEDRVEPFRPLTIMDGRRSLIPSDLLAAQVEVLAQLGGEIGHPALRARVNDVCRQLNRKNVDAGLRAVDAYVACVRAVLKGEALFDFDEINPASFPASEFLVRATIIARSMGWNRPEFGLLRQTIADVSKDAVDREDGWGFVHVGQINLSNDVWEGVAVADAAEKLAGNANLEADFNGQRELWELAAHAHHRAKDQQNEHRCMVAAAETFAANAEARKDSAMAQASFLNSAIQALMPVPGTAERRQELQTRLSEVQPRIFDEMSSFSHEEDITEIVERAEKFVSGKPLAEAIRACLMCERSPDPAALRKEVLDKASKSISAMMPVTVSDHQGRTRFNAPGLLSGESPNEDQVRYLISQHDQFRRHRIVASRINPIRRVIMEEHSLSLSALMPICEGSPFVPAGHEHLFAQGALRFFAGDDLEAAHLILPQLENSLRHILALTGVDTNRVEKDGTQEEAMLSRLLEGYREPLQKLIPPAILQEFDLLFNFRGGPSVRHELAHGKMPDNDFWSPDVTYSIWIVLHAMSLPLVGKRWKEISEEIARRAAG